MALPMPRLAPVTNATFSAMRAPRSTGWNASSAEPSHALRAGQSPLSSRRRRARRDLGNVAVSEQPPERVRIVLDVTLEEVGRRLRNDGLGSRGSSMERAHVIGAEE